MRRLRFAAASTAFLAACSAGNEPMPDVLLLTVDTLRPDYLGLNGYDRPTTPFLDELIARGTYFEGAVAPVPRTTQSLASLLTGAYPHTTGVRTLTDRLRDDVVPVTEVFASWGYQTRAFVVNGMLSPLRGLGRGFQRYEFRNELTTAEATTTAALAALQDADPALPLLAWVHFIDPHVPYVPDPAIAEAFDPGYEGRFRLGFGSLPTPRDRAYRAFPVGLPKDIATHRNPLPDEVNAHVRRLYAGEIRRVDDAIARLVGGLEELRGREPLIVFTADHGESLGEHDFYFDHGDYVYNASARVPLAIVLPSGHRSPAAARCTSWVSLVDVVPTLADLLGRALPDELAAQVEGRSLTDCLRDGTLPAAPVFVESGQSFYPELVSRRRRNDVAGRFRAVVQDDWKLVWTPFQDEDLAWELYHLASDPDETRNLAQERPAELRRLRPILEAWLARDRHAAGEVATPPIREADREALRSLGYLE